MTASDEELMIRIKEDNDEQAFELLVKRYKKPLLNFVYRFTGDQEIAEDLSQDVFLRLWANSDTYLPIAKFTTFLYTIAKNVCLNSLARSKSLPPVQSLSDIISADEADCEMQDGLACLSRSPEQELIGMEIKNRIKEAIGKLSPEHRLVFILTEYDGLSYQEVAAIVQCPVGTVASRKNTAVRLLRHYLRSLRE